MLIKEEAHRIADEWIAAWNAHDLDQIMAHYTEDMEIGPDGKVRRVVANYSAL